LAGLSLLALIAVGVWNVVASGGHPHYVISLPAMPAAVAGVSAWLILKAFASGCTAMTGVEAVRNGVRAFREPVAKTAQVTLTIIIAVLAVMLLGIAFLVRAYHIGATEPGSSGRLDQRFYRSDSRCTRVFWRNMPDAEVCSPECGCRLFEESLQPQERLLKKIPGKNCHDIADCETHQQRPEGMQVEVE
jgi:hypothetical protein